MNTHPGILGRKLGMSQVVAEDGTVTPVTVVQADCVVVGKRTQERDGYTALILGIDDRKPSRINKPLAGQYKTAMGALKTDDGKPPKEAGPVGPRQVLREFRCSGEYSGKFEVGAKLELGEVFTEGQFVDVRSTSRGRGFSGVMRRHNFRGGGASHGAHEYKRHGGSIGTNMTPGRVFPGKKMAGQYGNKTTTILNQRVVKVLPDKGLVLVAGGIPGSKNTVLELRGSVKKEGGMKGVA